MTHDPEQVLAEAWVDDAVHAGHPHYVAVLVAATGLAPGPGTANSDALLREAESQATTRLAGGEAHQLPEVAVWRDAFGGFGVKPREARSSVEALMRRASSGLPRIDRLTDVYNAVSVLHAVPIGGEDLDHYVGPPRLVVASGEEPFDTIADGQPVTQYASPGEVVWRDDLGVTCRRWNWRQCVRTRLSTSTTHALFIVDGLGAGAHERAAAAASALIEHLTADSPAATFVTRTIAR